jgi:hypothetical protein
MKEYKQMIAGTSDKLEENLERLDESLESSLLPRRSASSGDPADSGPLLQERDSTKQCLDICAQVSKHIAGVQPNVFENIAVPADSDQTPVTTLIGLISARQATNDALMVCESTLSKTSSILERHLEEVDSELQSRASESSIASSEVDSGHGVLEEEVESTKHALAYMAKVAEDAKGINVYEHFKLKEEANTMIVSTIGQLISAKYVSAGVRATTLLGQVSDETVQSVTKSLPQRNLTTVSANQQRGMPREFEGRYGAGIKLSSQEPTGTGSSPPK